MQDRLLLRVDLKAPGPQVVRTVAGLDVAYGAGDRTAAAVVVMGYPSLNIVEESVVNAGIQFPYVPGLFAFRELPPLVDALRGLSVTPDLLVCDGQGTAHPRRFGLACHLGVITGLPAIGVAKTMLVGTHPPVAVELGSWSAISDQDEIIGRALRTRRAVKPVYVSVGHKIGLGQACEYALSLCRGYRLPETTRRADHLARAAVAGFDYPHS